MPGSFLLLDFASDVLTEGEHSVTVSDIQSRILVAASRYHLGTTREDFVSAVYGARQPAEPLRSIAVMVGKLRAAMEAAGFRPLIKTVPRVGYKLTRSLTIVGAAPPVMQADGSFAQTTIHNWPEESGDAG